MWSAGISGCTIEPEPSVFPIRTFAAVVLGLVYFLPVFSHHLCLSVAVFALPLGSLPLCPPMARPGICGQWSGWLCWPLFGGLCLYTQTFSTSVCLRFSLCVLSWPLCSVFHPPSLQGTAPCCICRCV